MHFQAQVQEILASEKRKPEDAYVKEERSKTYVAENTIRHTRIAHRVTHRETLMRIALSGVFAACIIVATQLRVPTGIGYANLGDGVILFAASLLGPIAFFPAAIGSGLADLLAGYPIYVPATFLIKGLMGLAAGYILRKDDLSLPRKITAFVLAELIMIAGYFAYESLPFMYGVKAAAGSVIPNLAQAAVGIVLALLLLSLLGKFRADIRMRMSGTKGN